MKLWTKIRSWFARGAESQSSATDTEFTAEIVRITRILPHPNADKLELARFELKGTDMETAYEVVVGKGEFQPGSLAAYFSTDCILPTNHPAFSFLTSRSDCQGKTRYRLRAARLRGVFSQGLLVPAPNGSEWGAPVAELYGVTYHRAPEPGSGPSKDERYQQRKSARQPFPIYGVDSLKKLPRLFDESEFVHVTEKIHGTNFRFGWVRRKVLGIPVGWKFVVGSHHVIKGDRSRGFYGEDVWSDAGERMELAKKTWDYRGFTFYGELYGYTYSGKKIQDLTYGRKPEDGPGLACFDVRTPDGQWLAVFQRECVLADADLPGVPVIGPVKAPHAKTWAEGNSFLDAKTIREGVVVESLEAPRRKAKYVSEAYLMRKEAV